jgi:hypothetical protein
MDSGVGTVLRKARNRRKVELSEVEAATRIRLRYLRAIEDEEWDVLPGGVYTRGFIRTYASYLGLDGERLVEDYRGSVERWHRAPAGATSSGSERVVAPRPQRRLGGVPLSALVVVAVIATAALVVIAIPGGGSRGGGSAKPRSRPSTSDKGKAKSQAHPAPRPAGVSVKLQAGAEVWVCVLDAKGNALVDGRILEAGAEEGPFHSGSFTMSFGNGEVSMLIDGREAKIPATSSPIGYAVDSSGALKQLSEAERPSCA